MKPQRLQLSRRRGFRLQAASLALNGLPAVNVARPSRWGNPWKVAKRLPAMLGMGEVEDRDEAVRRYSANLEGWTLHGMTFIEAVRRELRGKNLACFCPPDQPCHADVLLRIANE